MPSLITYRLAWVSLTLDVGCLLQAAATDLGRRISFLVHLLLQCCVGPFMLLQMTEFHSFCDSVIFYCVNISHLLCTYSLSAKGHLSCFHVLLIGDSASVDIGVHVSFPISVSGFLR